MTVEARVNLQKGVPEDKRFPATDYTSDGSLMDNYLLMSVNARKQILDRYNAQEAEKQRKRAEAQEQAEIEKQTYQAIEKALDDIFKNWK